MKKRAEPRYKHSGELSELADFLKRVHRTEVLSLSICQRAAALDLLSRRQDFLPGSISAVSDQIRSDVSESESEGRSVRKNTENIRVNGLTYQRNTSR